MRKVLFFFIISFLSFPLVNLFSQPTPDSIDRATREVNEPFRDEAEKKLESPFRKTPIIRYGKIDLTNVSDGIYKGKARDYGDSVIKTEVTVENSQMADVKIVKARDNAYVKNAERIITSIITEQSIEVDTVTGATVTSKAILEAVENALEKEEEREEEL